jgi:hypothetical protein
MFDRRAVLSPPTSLRGAAALRILAVALLPLVGACGPRRHAPAVSGKVSPPVAASGLRAYRDPSTGAFTEPPAPTAGVAPNLAAPRVAAPALTEVNAPGGGTMIHLQGSFQSDVRATVGAHGQGVDVSCASRGARR